MPQILHNMSVSSTLIVPFFLSSIPKFISIARAMGAPHFGNVSQLVKWIMELVPIIYELRSVIKDTSREVNRTATDITLPSTPNLIISVAHD